MGWFRKFEELNDKYHDVIVQGVESLYLVYRDTQGHLVLSHKGYNPCTRKTSGLITYDTYLSRLHSLRLVLQKVRTRDLESY